MPSRQKSGGLKGLATAWKGMEAQSKMMGVLTLALVVSSFFLGYFYGQLRMLRGGVVAQGTNNNQQAAAPQAQAPEQVTELTDEQWQRVMENPAAVRGNEDSEVVLVEFTDYQCPFCQRHFQQTEPSIKSDYVDNDKIKYLIRDLPLPFHGNAHAAAQAARCAGDQDAYWEMHDALFEGQQEWSNGDPREVFAGYAQELSLSSGEFESCLDSEKYKQAVDDDLALASQVGASGTPTFIINGKVVVGAQPYSVFQTTIDEALAN